MWREWLVRTLTPRRSDEPRPRRKPDFVAPEFEGDGLHPGADEFRAAFDKQETVTSE